MDVFKKMLSDHIEESSHSAETDESTGCVHPRTDNFSGTVMCTECGVELEDVSYTGQPIRPTQSHLIRAARRGARRTKVPKIRITKPDGTTGRVR